MSGGLHPEKRPYYSILEDQLSEANARIAELQQSATTLEKVLSLVRSSLMEHGDCKSHLRYSNGLPMACAACMARIKLSEIVSEWKGPIVKVAAALAAKEE